MTESVWSVVVFARRDPDRKEGFTLRDTFLTGSKKPTRQLQIFTDWFTYLTDFTLSRKST